MSVNPQKIPRKLMWFDVDVTSPIGGHLTEARGLLVCGARTGLSSWPCALEPGHRGSHEHGSYAWPQGSPLATSPQIFDFELTLIEPDETPSSTSPQSALPNP